MKKYFALTTLALATLFSISCDNDDDAVNEPELDIEVVAPLDYSFTRDGESTVSFSGQTTRILMSEEIIDAMKDFDGATEQSLLDMFANENDAFDNSDLNASSKTVKSKTAASRDYFSTNASDAATIKAEFEGWLSAQVNEVFPAQNTAAAAGQPGQIADGESTRFVSAQGLEYNQLFNKGLIGALMVDQALNNYLGISVLDEATNVADNNNDIVAEGENYTTMEHKWDEAYGYLYGTSQDLANPNNSIGDDDSFLNKYIGRVEGDADYAGIAAEIFDALKLGRAAIVAKDYDLRDAQAAIVRTKLSEVIAIRAIYYLQQGKNALEDNNFGTAFHDLSEGYGFIYSMQFTRENNTAAPYFSRTEVQAFLNEFELGNGLWEITPATLDAMSNAIAERFGLSVDEAGSTI